jgi:hypothetical protein
LTEKITKGRLPATLGVESSSLKPSRVMAILRTKAERKPELLTSGAANCGLPA